MNLTIYQPLFDEQRTVHEKQTIVWDIQPPAVGAMTSIGGNRQWQVFAIEPYRKADQLISLAHIHPANEALPQRALGTVKQLKLFYPALAFYVHVAADGSFLGHGWRMNGDAPSGRLYSHKPTDHPTLLENVDLPWMVGSIDCYQPLVSGSFSQIHLCNCVPLAAEQLALA